jgi:pimeloyl-ACP methyl ester carboxylesterase
MVQTPHLAAQPVVIRSSMVVWLGLALASVLAACAAPGGTPVASVEPTATATSTPAQPSATSVAQEEHLVPIGDRSLWLECTGEGGPTVILESGMGGDHRTWERVQPQLPSTVRVCTYDRAGIGESDPAPGTRTAADAVEDLRLLLESAAIEPPYVLVGFSFGGVISQLFAATYPTDIAGLVLVESNHPLEAEQFEAHLTAEQIAEDRAAALDNPEGMDVLESFEQLQAAGPLPNVPLVVVTAGESDGWPPGWDAATFDALRAAQQADLATFTEQGTQVIAEGSGHHVPSQNPGTVIRAVELVLSSLPH